MRFGICGAALLLALTVFTAQAQEKGGAPGTNVDMPFLMAPMTDADGKLTGYAYISTRLTASSDADALVVRDKLPFIQDALVRDVNGESVAMAADPAPGRSCRRVEARLLADARRMIGAAKVKRDHHLHRPDRRPASQPDPGPDARRPIADRQARRNRAASR